MEWEELEIYTTTKGVDAVTGSLMNLGITGFVIKDAQDLEDFLADKTANWDYIDDDLMNMKNCETTITVYISKDADGLELLSAVKAELSALSAFCRENGLYLYVDGARLGSALMAEENDVTLADLAALTDAFCIGGTKNGLLMGEALVMQNAEMQDHLRWLIKQKGFMLAKGFVVGIQFEEALRDGLYFDMARHANAAAAKIAEAVAQSGFEFYSKPQSNQLFVILPPEIAAEAHEKYCCNIDRTLPDGRTVIRIVTSWATTDEAVEDFSAWMIKQLCFGLVKSIIEA